MTYLDTGVNLYADDNVADRMPEAAETMSASRATDAKQKVAYMMSRFPKITETFILYEMLAVQQQGVPVEVYPLRREKTNVVHPEAVPFVARAHFIPYISKDILQAHLHYALRRPRAYFGTLGTLLRENLGSRRYLIGALGLFPKAVYFAQCMSEDGVSHIHAHFASHPAAA
ncbi:MAG: hypothetical protein KDE54_01230, partial [Caldilineaceae bacterium]|nr:hypothetical protein [Caldilineaceae bacterium]MCB0144325.1 hypothetical protein [Caldilineaceae bacterium]